MTLWLLAATVALLPLLTPAGPGASAPVDAVAVLYILLAVAGLVRSGRAVRFPAGGPLLLIVAASLAATAASLSPATSLLSLLVETYLIVLLVCVASELEGDRRGLRVTLAIWSVAALAWSTLFIGLSLDLLPGAVRGLVAGSAGDAARVAGASRNPNLAASYLMTSFFVLLASPWPRRRPARLAAAGWLLAGLWVTGSNGALLGVAAGAAVMAVARGLRAGRSPGERFGVVGAALLTVAVATTAVVLAVGVPRVAVSTVTDVARHQRGGVFGGTLGRLDRGVPSRLAIWGEAWRAAGSQVAVGVGPGVAKLIPVGTTTLQKGLHNDYLAFLIERGLLGLLGLVALVAVLLRWSGRLLEAVVPDPGGGWLRPAGLSAAVVANLVVATNHESFHFRHVWILFGLVWAASRLVPEPPASPPARAEVTSEELGHVGG